MRIELEDLEEWADGAQRELERRLEHMREEKEKIDNYLKAIDMARKLATDNEKQSAEIESLRQVT